ncbi:hypothetical protein FHU36_001217 [Nonomuraea muscovyensis]|uniref:Uncharacterized protein n=1 Tax=Nonomuraea muscovyensis TaxID=1124761 RepID=A0A7X0BY10_9ACTN|nr:hypothetical protein [Nonomuraea muscovyensis]MBB6344708.1 hypothetical protein [Nonomuraea muscovyensis]
MTEPCPVLLEQRYRAVLRLLPASYRAEREDEMVAAFMEMSGEVPDERGPRPRWGEIASVVALAVRVRLGGAGAEPRFVAWGEAVRLLALLGVGFQALVSLYSLLSHGLSTLLVAPPGARQVALTLVDCAWVAAYVAVMRGHVRPAKAAALVGGGSSLYALATGLPVELLGWSEGTAALIVVTTLLALLVGFHRDARPAPRPWDRVVPPLALAALPLALELPLVALESAMPGPEAEPLLWVAFWLSPDGLAIVAVLVAGAIALARRRSPSVLLALATGGMLLAAYRLPVGLPLEFNQPLWVTGVVQCAMLAVMVSLLLVAGVRALPAARQVSA